jgi:DNA adenine methylase
VIYDGGKNAVFRNIVNEIPPHDVWVEGFGGSAAVTFFKRPAAENFAIEKDPRAAYSAWWRLLQIPQFAATAGPAKQSAATAQAFQVLTGDVRQWLGENSWLRRLTSTAVACCYFDPPYLLSSRSSARLRYECEFHTEHEHTEFLQLAKRLECHVLISHYRCPLYDRLLKGWRRVDFRAGSRGGLKIESLYCNFPSSAVLHDYRFAGANKDRRQRLKRRIGNLLKELHRLPPVERNAVLAAVAVEFNSAAEQSGATAVAGS